MSITLIVRTIVPALWLSFIGWLLTLMPILEPLREPLLAQSDFIVGIISALILGAWVAFINWVAPYLPDWLSRILMGSNKQPVYGPDAIVEYVNWESIPGTMLDLGASEYLPQEAPPTHEQ